MLHLVSVLLRRLIFSSFDDFAASLTPDQVNQIKNEVLLLLTTPRSHSIKLKITEVVSELAKKFLDDSGNNTWPEIVNFIFECIKSEDAQMKEIGLNILTSYPSIFGNQLGNYLDVIKQVFVHCLSESPQINVEIRVQALNAVCSFILEYCDEKPIVSAMAPTLPLMLQTIFATISLDDEHCEESLRAFQELAERSPSFLRPQFDSLVSLCMKIATDANMDDSRKHLALEIIISMAESAPSTVRKRGKPYLGQLVTHLLSMMTEIEDSVDEWTQSDVVEDDDFDSNLIIGETSLDRLATSLGGKTVLPLAINQISAMLGDSQDWKRRHAGLMALSTLGEGCHDQMLPMLKQIVEGIFPFLEDSHPRVRFAACNALGQMANDFAPDFQEKFHSAFIPNMVNLFTLSENPRVQAHSGAALVNFLEECTPQLVNQYIDLVAERIERVLSTKMQELVESGKKLVLEQAIITLAALADSSQQNFINYYDRFMPVLKYIIQNAQSEDLRTLRGKTIECVSLIGLAVGKEKFLSDAADVMNMLLKTQTGEVQLADDDPQLSYIISSWARICKILGPDFEQYLPYVMGPVLRAASYKVEVTMLDKDEAAELQEDNDWHCVNLGDQSFGLRAAGLDEKSDACQMLVCYAKELKHAFAEYVEQTAKIMVPLLKFYFHEGVRTAAAEILPLLLESGRSKGDQFVMDLWAYIWPEFVTAFETEPEKDVLAEMLSSLAECIEVVQSPMLSPKHLNQIRTILAQYLEEHFARAQERSEKRKDEDYDDGVEELLVDENDIDYFLLNKVSEVLHSLFVVLGPQMLPFLDELMPQLTKLATPDSPFTDLQWAICVMDDLIEYTNEHCIKYRDFFLPLFASGIQNSNPEIRQAAAYGWGILAIHGGPTFAEECTKVIPLLVQLIQMPEARSDENVGATENAISAVTKIMQYNGSMVNVNEILPVWFTWLPIWSDEAEITPVYEFLLKLIENRHPAILGDNNCNMPQIIAVIAEVYARNAIEKTSSINEKLTAFLNSLKVSLSGFD